MTTATQKPERFLLRVIKGGMEPADGYTRKRLREKGYHIGDVLFARLTKPRNPGFHRLAHKFGQLVADNIDDFHGMEAHRVLKRLQWESGIGCEEMGVKVPRVGFATIRIPLSLSFASMDEGEFTEVFRGLARWVAAEYWEGLSVDQVQEMVEVMPDE